MLYRKSVDLLNCLLPLENVVAGVKFLFSVSEYEMDSAQPLKGQKSYCQMLNSAMHGHAIKATVKNFSCISGAVALGLAPYEENDYSGRSSVDVNLYQDLVTARDACKNMPFCQHQAYGIALRPLADFTQPADIAIIVTNPYNMMRLAQGYSYKFGQLQNIRMTGHQGMCCECTSNPFETNSVNISLLCCGSRRFTHRGEQELGLGLPANRFNLLVEGVQATVNPMEPDDKKTAIAAKLEAAGFNDMHIRFHETYLGDEGKGSIR